MKKGLWIRSATKQHICNLIAIQEANGTECFGICAFVALLGREISH